MSRLIGVLQSLCVFQKAVMYYGNYHCMHLSMLTSTTGTLGMLQANLKSRSPVSGLGTQLERSDKTSEASLWWLACLD